MRLGNEIRKLSLEEKRALTEIIRRNDISLADSLLLDLNNCLVYSINNDDSILEFIYENYKRPDSGQMPLDVEGEILDEDGEVIQVILYWDRNRKLCELELLKTAEADVIAPRWNSFKIRE